MLRMRSHILIIFFALFTALLQAQSFDEFVTYVNSLPENERQAKIDSFLTTVPSFPYIENDTLAHFIYTGNVNSVSIPGDANSWSISESPMGRISGTNFWSKSVVYENDARLDYKFVLNGSNWILDPRNPLTVTGGYGPNSELRMPGYIFPEEINYRPELSHGTLIDTTFYSANLNNSRKIRVYLPPFYNSSSERCPVIIFNDGLEYISLANANNVLDYMINRGYIKPVIGVFIPPVNRTDEYAGTLQDEFTLFITEEVVPWINRRFRTLPAPDNFAVMGASNGGNIALWLALSHPEIFGNVAAQSSNIQTKIHIGFQTGPTLDLKIYMDLGTYDIPSLIPLVRNFIPVIDEKGYTYIYNEYHEGHSWGFWRAHIDDALLMFFPATQTSAGHPENHPNRFHLSQNYPNPFNPETHIKYVLEKSSRVRVTVYNTIGEKVRVLFHGNTGPGEFRVTWDGLDEFGKPLPSGIYIYRLQTDNAGAVSRKMLLLR
ncbi:MAG: alpha/beta hydrolase-fold protein [Calditrichaceae bacterium]